MTVTISMRSYGHMSLDVVLYRHIMVYIFSKIVMSVRAISTMASQRRHLQ